METVTVKFQKDVLKKIDKTMKEHSYSTRTDFIREAIRDKLDDLDRDELIKEFLKFKGSAKTKTSDKRLREIREEAYLALCKRKGWGP